MKNPQLGSNKLQSFIDFLTTNGPVRFGLEGKKLFYERNEAKVYLTDDDGNLSGIDAGAVGTANLADLAVTTEKLAASLDLTGKTVAFAIKPGTAVNAVAAVGLLTLTGAVKDGETFTIGDEVYEIDTDNVYTQGRNVVDVNTHAVAAVGTITVSGTPVDGETLVIGSQTYTFRAARAIAGEITISANNATQCTNIIAAITLDSTQVDAFEGDGDTVRVIAKTLGTIGNGYTFSDAATGVAVDGAGTLGTTVLGVDCTAANAIAHIVASIESNSYIVSAVAGVGTSVTVTAVIKGVIGNGYALSDTLSAGAFDHAHLGNVTAGVDGTVGAANEILADANYIYIATAANTIADANWVPIIIRPTRVNQTFQGTIDLRFTLKHYDPFTVSQALNITLEAGAVIGGSAEIRFIGDGNTTPTFSADFTKSSTSGNYDPALNAINKVVFYYDGTDVFYSITVL